MVLRRFVSIRGYPSNLYSDKGAQLVSANKSLKESSKISTLEVTSIVWSNAKSQVHLSSADAPWQNVISEAPNKSVRRAIALAIGESVMTFSELQTVCFEAAKLINERPVQ